MLRCFKSHSKDPVYQFIKNILGFKPENVFLYHIAFTHRSANQVDKLGQRLNNERLEYLGDAVLSSIVAELLFIKYPNTDEGFLTEMRSKIVSRASLNRIASKMGFNSLIRRENEYQNSFKSIEGDTLEALIGAIYLDKGYDFTKKVIINRIIHIHLNIEEIEHTDWNFKSKLIDTMQREHKQVDFRVVDTVGTGHKKLYHVEVAVEQIVYGKGQDFSIKAAEQAAAEQAYHKLFPVDKNNSLKKLI